MLLKRRSNANSGRTLEFLERQDPASNVSSVYRITRSQESPRKADSRGLLLGGCTDSSLVYLAGFSPARAYRAARRYRLFSETPRFIAIRSTRCTLSKRLKKPRRGCTRASPRSLANGEPINRACAVNRAARHRCRPPLCRFLEITAGGYSLNTCWKFKHQKKR